MSPLDVRLSSDSVRHSLHVNRSKAAIKPTDMAVFSCKITIHDSSVGFSQPDWRTLLSVDVESNSRSSVETEVMDASENGLQQSEIN